jgi:hypothetical protein
MEDDLGVYVAERLTSDLTSLGTPVVPASTVLQATPPAGAALYDNKLPCAGRAGGGRGRGTK